MEPTVDEYEHGLVSMARAGFPPHQLAMLRAHYEAPGHTITATKIADEVHYRGWRGVNLHYGKFTYTLAEHMKRPASEAKDLALILAGPSVPGPDGQLELVLRPELALALDRLCWSWAGKT
jgi:hypothetical protein